MQPGLCAFSHANRISVKWCLMLSIHLQFRFHFLPFSGTSITYHHSFILFFFSSVNPYQHPHFRHIQLLLLCFLHCPRLGSMTFKLILRSHRTSETLIQFSNPEFTLFAVHRLAAAGRHRLSETEAKFVFETFRYAFGGRYCIVGKR